MGKFPYPAIVRLLQRARANWQAIDGQAALSGIDPFQLPLNRFLNLIYAWLLEREVDHKDGAFERWYDELTRPLPGSDPDRVDRDTIEDEMAMFRAGRQNVS